MSQDVRPSEPIGAMTLPEFLQDPVFLLDVSELAPAEAVLPWLIALASLLLVACGIELILLVRARGARRALDSAHTASGQGGIVVDRKGRVLATNGPAKSLFWSNQTPRQSLRVSRAIVKLLENPDEQHHVVKIGAHRMAEIWLSKRVASNRLSGLRGIAVRDVTEQQRGQRHLMQLAHYDSLTGLGNRRLFVDRLETEIERAREAKRSVALLYLDLDRFKDVNDTLGHGAGDELLKCLAKRFQARFRSESSLEGVSVYRLAGDEFAIILPDPESTSEIERAATDVLAMICDPMEIAERTISSSGSVGVAVFPQDADDVEDLVKHADSALYVAKDMGRARFVFYEPSFGSDADRSHKIAQELRSAIERDEFSLHYQPKIDVATNTVAGFEALLRWFNSDLGFVGPAEFIPVAEDRGTIIEIGAWCLREACRQIRVWQNAGFTVVPVSVNVSSAQFRDSDVQRIVSDALVEHDVHPSLLEIELTESLLLEDDQNTGLALRDLRAIGVRVALDDFGTGYSALTYLNRFPLDAVKMDRGFLRDIEDSSAAAGIAAAVISMSHSLGFEVIAEGVDSPRQAELLREMECDQIQGFLYSPGIPSEEATRFLAGEGAEPPQVEPIVDSRAATIEGEIDPDADESIVISSVSASSPAVHPTAPPRLLVIDSVPSTLGRSAYQMTRLGGDVHLMTELDEATLFVETEEPVLDLVIAPPQVDLGRLGILVEKVKKQARDHVPRLLIVGPEPEADRRAAIRDAGADWVLWEPYSDPELRFFVNAARTNRNWKFQRQSVRVPVETIAWIRAGAKRGTGVVTSLSRRGAFVETDIEHKPGQPIRLEFKIDGRMISVFANVTQQRDDAGEGALALVKARGIDVIFYEVDASTDEALADGVERLWLRYRP